MKYKILLSLLVGSIATVNLSPAAGSKRKAVDAGDASHCEKRVRLDDVECIFGELTIQGKKRKKTQEADEGNPAKKALVLNKKQEKLNFDLFEAARTNKPLLIADLITQGGQVNSLTSYYYYRTPLHIAARCHHIACIEALLEHEAKVNALSDYYQTPLHETVYTCGWGGDDPTCIKLLLKYGAKINVLDHKRNTPLHIAAQYGHRDYVETLLARGADCSLKNSDGKTAKMLAEEGQKDSHKTIIALLNKQEKIMDSRR